VKASVIAPVQQNGGSGRARYSAGSLLDYGRCRTLMERAYPAVFTPRKTPPKPLKVGVAQEIILPEGLSKAQLRRFLAVWCGRPEYLEVLIKGGYRFGLDGVVAGEVTAAQQVEARNRLEAIMRRRADRRAALAAASVLVFSPASAVESR